MRFVIRCCVGWLLLGTGLPAFADSIYLNPEGRKNVAVLRQRMGTAPIFEDAVQGLSFIRCVIVGERAARNPKAPYKSIEGSPEYDVIAFDGSGDQRSPTFTISDAWIDHIENHIDSDLDVRQLFSNRDQLAGVALGGRPYFAMARRAADPAGALGLWRNDVTIPAEPSGVIEGGIVRFLKDPPVFSAADPNAAKWGLQRRAELQALMKSTLAERLPTAHMHRTDTRPSLMVRTLTEAVARERAYRLSRTGFDRAALSMLVFIFDLAAVRHREPPAGDNAADAIYFEGSRAITDAVVMLEIATREDGVGLLPCADGVPFCLDASQHGEVLIDALLASDGLFHTNTWWRSLTQTLIELHAGRDKPDSARIDLRGPSLKLLAHTINPPAGRDDDSRRRRAAAAREVRKTLYNVLFEVPKIPRQHEAARAALSAGGWGSAEELVPFATELLRMAQSDAADVGTSAADLKRRRATAAVATLRAIASLGASQVPAEKQAAALILDGVERVRKRVRDDVSVERGDRVFLELWNAR